MTNGLKYILIALTLSIIYISVFTQVSLSKQRYKYDKSYYLNLYQVTDDIQVIVDQIKNDENRMIKITNRAHAESKPIPSVLISVAKKEKEEINKIIKRIKNDKKWYNNVKELAIERGISEEEMLVGSARYVITSREQ